MIRWRVERRIVCVLCSGAKYTFQHSPDGLALYGHHIELVHRLVLTPVEKAEIANV